MVAALTLLHHSRNGGGSSRTLTPLFGCPQASDLVLQLALLHGRFLGYALLPRQLLGVLLPFVTQRLGLLDCATAIVALARERLLCLPCRRLRGLKPLLKQRTLLHGRAAHLIVMELTIPQRPVLMLRREPSAPLTRIVYHDTTADVLPVVRCEV